MGATSCTCIGQNRAFQFDDGWCVCQPGYEFVDSNFVVSSGNDGSQDCQPIVYSRCSSTEVRNSAGVCVTGSAYCNEVCSKGGSFSATTGTCQCNDLTILDSVCDKNCQSSASSMTCDIDGNIVVTKGSTSCTISSSDLSLDAGAISCGISKNIYPMSTGTGSFVGIFGLSSTVQGLLSGCLQRRLLLSNDTAADRRYLAETSSEPALVNPLVCLKLGDSILFQVNNKHYPEYDKDSLLNTNKNFDYGAFRSLAIKASSTYNVSSFGYTFTASGNYVFKLSTSSSTLTIISVMAQDVN